MLQAPSANTMNRVGAAPALAPAPGALPPPPDTALRPDGLLPQGQHTLGPGGVAAAAPEGVWSSDRGENMAGAQRDRKLGRSTLGAGWTQEGGGLEVDETSMAASAA